MQFTLTIYSLYTLRDFTLDIFWKYCGYMVHIDWSNHLLNVICLRENFNGEIIPLPKSAVYKRVKITTNSIKIYVYCIRMFILHRILYIYLILTPDESKIYLFLSNVHFLCQIYLFPIKNS